MAKDLIIVESPTKAKTLGKFLGKNYIIKASMGHIRDLPKKEIGIDIEGGFKPKYVTDRSKAKVIKQLKESAKQSDAIYLAPDHDREGEAIAWHLQHILKDVSKGKHVFRIIFNEITKRAVTEALEKPGEIDQLKVDSQQARRILDRLVGYSISPLLWKVISGGLSAGRVQSVALRIICEREEAIKAFKKTEYWTIEADFFKNELNPFHSVLHRWKDEKPTLNNKNETDSILSTIENKDFHISDKKVSNRKIHPLPPFITSTLQQESSKIYNFSSKKTMMIAQQLYEGVDINGESTALISYMRTDSLRLSQEALSSVRKYIGDNYGDDKLYQKERVYKNKSSAQDAHEAIRPTDVKHVPERLKDSLSPDHYKLYSLIWQRTIATQMIPVEVQTINLEIAGGDALFKASGGTITNPGFLEVYKHLKLNMGENIDSSYKVKDGLQKNNLKGHQHFTKPPARYSEATLIKELEAKGIGRPSTYSSITSTIKERQYVDIMEKKFFPTELGMAVNKFLVDRFDEVFNVEFTKVLEDGLDKVAEGKNDWQSLLKDYYGKIDKLIKSTDIRKAKNSLDVQTDIKCDKCGAPMVIKWGRRGRFLGCSNYPNCSNIKNFYNDENGDIKIEKPEILDEKCPQDEGSLVVKNSRYGKFIGCSNYPKCKYTRKLTLGIKCPKCLNGEIVANKDKKGRTFYGCSSYPECKFISNNKPKNVQCPECDNNYLEETSGKLVCPKCKTDYS